MWIFLNDSFLSIVAHRGKPGVLLVRARQAGDIEAVFPESETWEDTQADYRHRAEVPAAAVASAIAGRLTAIDYPNFKSSVPDSERHQAYMDVWTVMSRWGRG